jgi:HEAT repeat protein
MEIVKESSNGKGAVMKSETESLETLFQSSDPYELRRALQIVRDEVSRVGTEAARHLFELVSSLFYIDPLDRPDLAPVLDEAISMVIGFGDWVIPALVENLDQGDIKAQMASAEALGRIGADAIDPLMEKYRDSEDPDTLAFVLYGLGKIKSPLVARAVDLALDGAGSGDLELRDTATRTLGRFAEAIPAGDIPPEAVKACYDLLRTNLADPHKAIKAKALRSLGKLARHGHLAEDQRRTMQGIALNLLGEDDEFRWDRAYVVRKEAREALDFFRDRVS